MTSDELLDFDHVPKSMIVLAGAVGVEFASVFKRFSADVTIIEMLDRLVPIEDEEISAELHRAFRRRGIASLVGARFESAKVNEGEGDLHWRGRQTRDDQRRDATRRSGRRPYTDGLGLENTKCEVDRGFIKVDSYMRASRTSAIGDVVATPLLAHVASKEAAWPPNTSRGAIHTRSITTMCPIALTANPKSAASG